MKKKYNLIYLLSILICLTNCKGQGSKDKNDSKLVEKSENVQNIKESVLVTGWYYVSDSKDGIKKQLDKSDEVYFINPEPIVAKENFEKNEIKEFEFNGEKTVELLFKFDSDGTKKWAVATEKSINKKVALVINNVLVCVPRVNNKINGGLATLSRGDVYTKKELEEFKKQIEE